MPNTDLPAAPAPPAAAAPPTSASVGTAPAPPPGVVPPVPSGGFGWLLLQMILVLVAICALAYAVLRYGVRRFQAGPLGRSRGMRVVQRLGLEPRRSLYVVEIGKKYFVVGVGEGGVSLLSELDAETAAGLERAEPSGEKKSFRDLFLKKSQ